jgi:hypothetical protein
MNDLIESAKKRVKDAEGRLEKLRGNREADPQAIRLTEREVEQEQQRLHRLEDLDAEVGTNQ